MVLACEETPVMKIAPGRIRTMIRQNGNKNGDIASSVPSASLIESSRDDIFVLVLSCFAKGLFTAPVVVS